MVRTLSKFLADSPQENVLNMLSAFSCSRDKDVESFLKEKAIIQEKKHISRTYLIFAIGEEPELAAYFTIAVSSMNVTELECSNEMRKKMNINNDLAQSYLIGQIGKSDGSQKGLGKFMIQHAIAQITEANTKVGCRVIRLDCKPSLVRYYTDNGFILTRRNKEGNLVQMIRIIGAGTTAPS
jgi:hypothetical protein